MTGIYTTAAAVSYNAGIAVPDRQPQKGDARHVSD
jgi:hypothetical protein